jgi:hypothetical protein
MTPTFNSLSDLSTIEWDGVSEHCICVLKTRITRNPSKRRVGHTFAEMDAWLPSFSKIMWHRPYRMHDDPKYTVEKLKLYLRRLPAGCAEPLFMLHEAATVAGWIGTKRHCTSNTVEIIDAYGSSYVMHAAMEANAIGIMAVFDRCEVMGLSPRDTTQVLKYCMTRGVVINHQLDIRASLFDADLWTGLEIAEQLGSGWIEPVTSDSDLVALPEDFAFRFA